MGRGHGRLTLAFVDVEGTSTSASCLPFDKISIFPPLSMSRTRFSIKISGLLASYIIIIAARVIGSVHSYLMEIYTRLFYLQKWCISGHGLHEATNRERKSWDDELKTAQHVVKFTLYSKTLKAPLSIEHHTLPCNRYLPFLPLPESLGSAHMSRE